jgi:hypothetical protein
MGDFDAWIAKIFGTTDALTKNRLAEKYGLDPAGMTQDWFDDFMKSIRAMSADEFAALAESLGVTSAALMSDIDALIKAFGGLSDAITATADDVRDAIEKVRSQIAELTGSGSGSATSASIESQINAVLGRAETDITSVTMGDLLGAADLLQGWFDAAKREADEAAEQDKRDKQLEIDAQQEIIAGLQESQRTAELWEQAADQVQSLLDSIDNTMKSIQYSPLNVSLPSQKAPEAQEDLIELYNKAMQTQDINDIQKFLSFAPTALQEYQAAFKSSGAYQEFYEDVMGEGGMMESLKDEVESTSFEEGIFNTLKGETNPLLEEANEKLEQLREELAAITPDYSEISAAFEEIAGRIETAMTDVQNYLNLILEFQGIDPGDAVALIEFFNRIIDEYGWTSSIVLHFIGKIDWGIFTTDQLDAYLTACVAAAGWSHPNTLAFVGKIDWGVLTKEQVIAHLNTIKTLEDWNSPAVLKFLNDIDWGMFTTEEIIDQIDRINALGAWESPAKLVFAGGIDWGEITQEQIQAALDALFEGVDLDTDIFADLTLVLTDEGVPWSDLKQTMVDYGYTTQEVEKRLKAIYVDESVQFSTWGAFEDAWTAMGMADSWATKYLKSVFEATGATGLQYWSSFVTAFSLGGVAEADAEKVLTSVYNAVAGQPGIALWSDFKTAMADAGIGKDSTAWKTIAAAYNKDSGSFFTSWSALSTALGANGISPTVTKTIQSEYEANTDMTWTELEDLLALESTPDSVIREIKASVNADSTVTVTEADIWKEQVILLLGILHNTAIIAHAVAGLSFTGLEMYQWNPSLATKIMSLFPGANIYDASSVPRFYAEGGLITSPTLGLLAEAGYPEAVIPMKDGINIPVKWVNGGSTQDGAREEEVKLLKEQNQLLSKLVKQSGQPMEIKGLGKYSRARADDVIIARNQQGKLTDTGRYYR